MRRILAALGLWAALAPAARPARGSDHDDTAPLKASGRHDLRLTDLFAFLDGPDLVLVLCANPAIPPGAAPRWPRDASFALHVDRHSKVRREDPGLLGGTIEDPDGIRPDLSWVLRFPDGVNPALTLEGAAPAPLGVFTGLRDDPFIRGPRIGRNVLAIVLELPLAAIAPPGSTLLVWGVSHRDGDPPEQPADLAARSLRSQVAAELRLNDLPPWQHRSVLGLDPDVLILDTSRPLGFPNGRLLGDDVVDLARVPSVLATDAPFPSANDRPFLREFPYLAAPHR